MLKIKVGFLVSYDYEFLKISLPLVYPNADEIFLAVDKDGKTWSGNDLIIDEKFWSWIKEIDKSNKITIYKDQFYAPDLSPMECDTRERNMLGKAMGDGGWHVQIDSDEYFVDFGAFAKELRGYDIKEPVTIQCSVATLFKELSSGYLMIGDSVEKLSFATNNPKYDLARTNISGNTILNWNDLVVHQSWARTESEIQQKLNNWSHKLDFNTHSLFNLWWAVDEHNYPSLRNFHPLEPAIWPRLVFINGNIEDTITALKSTDGQVPEERPRKKKRKNVFSRIWKAIKSKD